MNIINDLFVFRNKRALGQSGVLENALICNRRRDFQYQNYLKTTDVPLEYALSISGEQEQFNKFVNSKGLNIPLLIDDYEQLIFSLLSCLNYSINNNKVNQRISLLCLFTLNNVNNGTYSDEFIQNIFNILLTVCMNTETFIKSLKLQIKKLYHNNKQIDLFKYNSLYFEYVDKEKDAIIKKGDIKETDISIIKNLYHNIISMLLGSVNFGNYYEAQVIENSLKLYQHDRNLYYQKLLSSLDYFYLCSWEKDKNVSLYYGSTINTDIEDLCPKQKKVLKLIKLEADLFIDIYVIFVLLNQKNHIEIFKYVKKSQKLDFLQKIIHNHPCMIYSCNG